MMVRPLAFLLILTALAQGKPDQEARSRPAAPPAEIGATVQFAPGGDLIGPWQGFVVELDSRTKRDLDLTIRIEDDSYLGVATRHERLSPGARKRVFLYSPGAFHARGIPPRYRITDASGREQTAGIVPFTARSYGVDHHQIGLFCRGVVTDLDLGMPGGLNGQEVRFSRLSPDTFPDRWIGLAALDLLILHDAPLDELTSDQGRALADYVRQGGTVVMSPGPVKGWLSHPVLAAFAPVRAAEPRLVPSLRGLNAAYGDFRRAEPFLVHPLQNGVPFNDLIGREIVTIPAGFGRSHVLSFDLLRAPFDTWTGRRGLWTALMSASPRWSDDARSSFPSAATPQQRRDQFQQMARLINPYPSFGLILGLAAIFLLTVGPLNYMFLWKLRRTLLLVVTVPAISIGFLALIVGLGYVIKGTTTVVHSARLLSTRSGLDSAHEIHLYSLFSPSTRTYDVSCDPGTFGQPPWRWGQPEAMNYGRGEAMSTLSCETGAGLTLRGLGTGQWQSWDLEAHALHDFGAGIRFEREGGVVSVANGSPRHIERGVFIETRGPELVVVPFGAIAPGKSEESRVEGPPVAPLAALGLAKDSLGGQLLFSWMETLVRRGRGEILDQSVHRFLLCVLRNVGEPVRINARASDRSRAITLLHVGEAP